MPRANIGYIGPWIETQLSFLVNENTIHRYCTFAFNEEANIAKAKSGAARATDEFFATRGHNMNMLCW